ncbi:kinase-like protein [Favolaschia claudopus]|uniref:Kinase-like protein n=1 Tax=Favolaschia claudopus TaxID=2862362 RepID=A0AAW0D1Q5_9AGAR
MSAETEQLSITKCTGAHPGDGCAGEFPRKDYEGLCAKCLMLESVENDPAEFQRRQCLDCGAAARFLPGEQCGTCRRLHKQETGEEDDLLVASDRAFGQAFQAKMQAGKNKKKILAAAKTWMNPQPLPATAWREITTPPTASLNTETLDHLRNIARRKEGRFINVNVLPVFEGKLLINLPSFSQAIHADTPVPDVVQEILEFMNGTWKQESSEELILQDVFLLWHKNQNFLPGALEGTLGGLYDSHRTDYNASAYFQDVPPRWKNIRGESVCFNLNIDSSLFESRTGIQAPSSLESSGKRGLSDATQEPPRKRCRETVMAPGFDFQRVSSQVLDRPSVDPPSKSTTPILLRVASLQVGCDDGEVTIQWDSEDKREAFLDDVPYASGKTKKVYQIVVDGKSYVAKRFYEIGRGDGLVSIDENTVQLTNEMIRLAKGQWFLDKFYERAEETATSVTTDFRFSEGLLVQEIIGESASAPSPAAGQSLDAFLDSVDQNPDSAITWLLEPLRASYVEKWSGTLEHPTHSNKAGKTMDAFVHFCFVYSQRSLVFADLQSTRGRSPTGKAASILFDVMTHTILEDSGVGDHGQAGIDAIQKSHRCGAMCHGLEMGDEPEPSAVEAQGSTRRKSGRKTASKGR